MTRATRNALEQVSGILHDAGWDALEDTRAEFTDQSLQRIRDAYARFLGDDYLAIIQRTFGAGQKVEDAGRSLGKNPDESKALLNEALERLVGFAEIAQHERS
jgi:hypothetical protein